MTTLTPEQSQELVAAVAQLQESTRALAVENQKKGEEIANLRAQLEESRSPIPTSTSTSTSQMTPLVNKWAPEAFDGTHEKWKAWSLKFRSFVAAFHQGNLGQQIKKVEEDRDKEVMNASLPAETLPCSASLYGALIATCEGKALVIVERAGSSEGFEAWRRLLVAYEPQTKVTKIAKMLQILSWTFTAASEKDVQEQLERYDQAIALYEREVGMRLDDDTKIGVVIKGLDAGVLREHLLLTSEQHTSYAAFRENLDKIVRARSLAMSTATPMALDAVNKGSGKGDIGKGKKTGGGGKGGSGKGGRGGSSAPKGSKFDGFCNHCGKYGHKVVDCWQKQEASNTGKKKEGKKGKDSGKKGGGRGGGKMNDLSGNPEGNSKGTQVPTEVLSSLSLCELALDHVGGDDRRPADERQITWHIDSGACVTVAPQTHPALRGYRIHLDNQKGQHYKTASGNKVVDEGCRVLVGKGPEAELPVVVKTRIADVSRPLMSVAGLVDNGFDVTFSRSGAYAKNSVTGRKIDFARVGPTWTLKMDLEAPAPANTRLDAALAALSADPFSGQGKGP